MKPGEGDQKLGERRDQETGGQAESRGKRKDLTSKDVTGETIGTSCLMILRLQ